VAAKKTVARKTVAKKTVATRKPVAKRTSSTKKAAVAAKAGVCMKKHKHTAACGRAAASGAKICASSAKRKTHHNRTRTAHSWRQQLMKLVAR
ncbi:histone H1-like DNA-binding protein Hc2, partial [Chlamydia suis]